MMESLSLCLSPELPRHMQQVPDWPAQEGRAGAGVGKSAMNLARRDVLARGALGGYTTIGTAVVL